MPLQMVEVTNPHATCCIRRVEEQMLREDDKCASFRFPFAGPCALPVLRL